MDDGSFLLQDNSPGNLLPFRWRDAKSIPVSEENNTLSLAFGTHRRFNELAPACGSPQSTDKSERTPFCVRLVVLAHNLLDGLSCLVRIVERNSGDEVVSDMGLDDTMEEVATNETEFAINCCGSTTSVSPRLGVVVGKRWVGMLKEGDGNLLITERQPSHDLRSRR